MRACLNLPQCRNLDLQPWMNIHSVLVFKPIRIFFNLLTEISGDMTMIFGRHDQEFRATWLWLRATWLRATWLSGDLTVIPHSPGFSLVAVRHLGQWRISAAHAAKIWASTPWPIIAPNVARKCTQVSDRFSFLLCLKCVFILYKTWVLQLNEVSLLHAKEE